MNQEIKKQWVSSLRSGEYEQGTDCLEKDGKFCCLGVLCDLAARAGVVERKKKYGMGSYDNNEYVLPQVVVEWADLSSEDPEIGRGETLSNLNDAGHDFKLLADIIESIL